MTLAILDTSAVFATRDTSLSMTQFANLFVMILTAIFAVPRKFAASATKDTQLLMAANAPVRLMMDSMQLLLSY